MRSVMLPPLLFLCKLGLAAVPPPRAVLTCDEFEPRRTIRFVWMLPMGSGDVVWERRAAAAAAEERLPWEVEDWRNAELAAVVAAERVLRSTEATELAREDRRPKTIVNDRTCYLARVDGRGDVDMSSRSFLTREDQAVTGEPRIASRVEIVGAPSGDRDCR